MSDIFKKQSRLSRFSLPALVGLLIITSCHHLRAQPQDSLAVIIQNIAADSSSIRGYTASYPYPILSFISILNNDDRPVRGLADTLRWLTPSDVANNGQAIPNIWQPILEYTSGKPVLTEANLYNLRPEPNFIEICENCQPIVPTTTMLLMDVSGSINNIPGALDSAKAGILRFVADMRPEDRAGVIQFNCEFKHLPPTNDQQVLIDFVQSAQTGPWTPLYEAIINAIDSMKNEGAIRRSIVVYTDGKNNLPRDLRDCRQIQRPLLNEDSVIVAAKKFQIPVYMIALANSANEIILKKIASQTGGRFFKTLDGITFSDIYKRISDIIQNFYVMAHVSPQPCESEFPRTVDITVTDNFRTGNAKREYSVAGPPRLYDLRLTKTSDRDSVFKGDEIKFTLTIENRGPNAAHNISLLDSLSGFLSFKDVAGKTRFWQFDSLAPQRTLQVSYSAIVSDAVTDSTKEISNFAKLIADCDTDSTNDSARSRLTVFKRKPYDLSIQKSASGDSINAGEIVTYTIVLSNLGPSPAFNIVVRDTLPDILSPINVDSVQGNVLFWRFDSLRAAQNFNIVYQARVDNPLTNSPVEIINTARVFADSDTNAHNNADSVTVIAQPRIVPPKPYDLAIQKQTDKDNVLAGEIITYTLDIQNSGPNPAFEIAVLDTLPDLLTPINVDSVQGNVLFWKVGSLLASQSTQIVFHARVDNLLPDSPTPLVNVARVFAENDTNAHNNADSVTIIARNRIVPPKPYDLAIQKQTDKDNVLAGEIITYTLTLTNHGPNTALEIAVHDTLAEYVAPLDIGSPHDRVLFWDFDSLQAAKTITLTYHGRVQKPLPVSPSELVNIARVFAANDSDPTNNRASARVIAENEVVPACADISVTISTNKDSLKIGEEFRGELIVRNLGPVTAFDILAQVTIPELITPFGFEPQPDNDLNWRLDSLRAGDDEIIVFRGRLNSAPPVNSQLGLTARVSSGCNDDDSNNIATAFFTAVTIFEDCNLFHLDANVFAPDRRPLGILFELSEPRVVRLDVYDLASYHVTRITELSFPAGENRFGWNGNAANGQKVGSGVYVIALRSDNLLCWKKVIVVR